MAYKDKNVEKNTNFKSSLCHALSGLKIVFKEERNFKFQILSAITAIILAVISRFNTFEWIVLIFTICLVLLAEILNTAFENLVDLIVDYKYHKLAKKVKDITAALVLVTSLFAVVIGLLLFVPKWF